MEKPALKKKKFCIHKRSFFLCKEKTFRKKETKSPKETKDGKKKTFRKKETKSPKETKDGKKKTFRKEEQKKNGMEKMILITGGTGYLGKELLKSLNNNDVRILARNGSLVPPGYEVARGDLMDKNSLINAVNGVDCVVHLAAVTHSKSMCEFYNSNVQGTKNLIDACKSKHVQRFIFISSMASKRKFLDDYGRSKKQAEEIVIKSGLDYTILRPTMIYGGDSKIMNMITGYIKKIPLIIPVIGNGKGKIQPVYVGDVVKVIVGCLENKKSIGKSYDVLGGSQMSFDYFLDFMASRLNIRKIKIHIPTGIVVAGINLFTLFYKNFPIKKELAKSFDQNVEGDNHEAERDFNFRFKRLSEAL